MQRFALALTLVAFGCTKDTEGNPFDAGAAPVTTAESIGQEEDDEESEESSSGAAEEEDDTSSSGAADVSSSGGADVSTSGPDPATTGVDPTAGGGGQPATGQYSHCLDAAECMGVNLCIQIQMDMMVVDGFCTSYPCANAAVDCDPSPGGTATPICMPVNVNMMDTNACALDCSGGKTCPTGMECLALTSGSVCA